MTTPRFADAPAMLLVGIRRTHQFADVATGLVAQWAEFATATAPVTTAASVTYGVIGGVDMQAQWMDYLCGVEVASFDAAPASLDRMRIPAAHYAVFEHRGHISSLRETWGIAMPWLANNGAWRDAETPPFERYDARFDPATGMGVMEIWVPVLPT
jgi:AraC family transcriptional regulator